MEQMEFRIDTEEGRIYLNGEDISHFIKGVSFVQRAMEPAQIGIEFSHRAKVLAEGPMELTNLVNTTDSSAGATLLELDWSKLKEKALNDLDFGDDPLEALLKVVLEALNGS